MGEISFQPSPGFILVKIVGEEPQEVDIVQDTDKTPASTGEVIAIGAPALHESGGMYESHVKVGDLIVFKPYGIDSIMIDNEEHRIISFLNIRGVLKNED